MDKKILAILLVGVIAVSAVSVYVLLSQQPGDSAGALTVRWENVNGAKISGVTLTIMGPQEAIRSGVSGENGEYTFTDLPEGDYQGIATKDGYQTVFINAKVTSAKTTTLNSGINTESPSSISVSITPMATIIRQSNTGAVTINAVSTDDTAGTFSLGYTDAEGTGTLPSGLTATSNPENLTLTAGGEATSTLTLSASSTAPKGIYKIGVTISDQNSPLGYGWLLLQIA
jgi:hypothetical protein